MGLSTQDPNLGGGSGTPPVADTTLKRLALTPDALAGASALSALSITQTLNTSGSPVIFDVDVTDEASDAGSLLANFKVGGATVFGIGKNNSMTLGPGFSINGSSYLNLNLGGVQKFGIGGSANFSYQTLATPTVVLNDNCSVSGPSPATLQLGVNHATTASTQTVKAHDVVTGTGANLVLAGGTGSVANGDVILDGGNRAAFVADANSLISFTGGDTVNLMTLESDFGALVSAFNALKATVISHGLMNPA